MRGEAPPILDSIRSLHDIGLSSMDVRHSMNNDGIGEVGRHASVATQLKSGRAKNADHDGWMGPIKMQTMMSNRKKHLQGAGMMAATQGTLD